MPDAIRMGVVGLGWVGQARHIPTISANRHYRLIGVADRRGERAAEVARKVKGVRSGRGTSLAQIDWIDDVEAISIATPPMAHHDLVCEALSRGLHVITEKPFAMNVGQGEAMANCAATASRSLAVVHNFQFARSMRKLYCDLESGSLGNVRAIRAVQLGNPLRRLPEWYQELPLGLFYDESPHLLYLLASVAGPLSLVKAVGAQNRGGNSTPDQIDAWFKGDGVDYPITLSCNFQSSVSEWYLIVHGDKGAGVVDIFRDIYLRLPNDRAHATRDVIRTSSAATLQHWAQHVSSGIPHLLGKLRYGNEEVFDRFASGIAGDDQQLKPVGADAALSCLRLQHEIISRLEKVYA